MQEKFVQKNSGRFEVQDASKGLNVCTEYMTENNCRKKYNFIVDSEKLKCYYSTRTK